MFSTPSTHTRRQRWQLSYSTRAPLPRQLITQTICHKPSIAVLHMSHDVVAAPDPAPNPATAVRQPGASIAVYQILRPGKHAALHAIWNGDDALALRQRHGILGDFVGTMPKHFGQNQFLTVPLLLSDTEVTHGVDRGFIHVLSDTPDNYPTPSTQVVDAYWATRDADVQRQVDEAVKAQRAERQKRANPAVGSKRKHAELDKQQDIPSNQHAAPVNGHVTAENEGAGANGIVPTTEEKNADEEEGHTNANVQKRQRTDGFFSRISRNVYAAIGYYFPSTSAPAPSAATGTLQAGCTTSPRKEGEGDTRGASQSADVAVRTEGKTDTRTTENERLGELDKKAAHQASMSVQVVTATAARDDEVGVRRTVTHIPCPPGMSQRRRLLRRAVFDDLRDRGYILGCGSKFGADFLAYAGDQQLFHAALAVVVADGDTPLAARDIVALGRLGDSTRKRTVLAWTQQGGKHERHKLAVKYVGVQWEETLP